MIFRRPYGQAATLDGIPLLTRGAVDYQANPTLASGDAKISKDGGAEANLATLPAVTPAGGKLVRIALSAAEMQAQRIVVTLVDQTNPKEWEDQRIIVETDATYWAVLDYRRDQDHMQDEYTVTWYRDGVALTGGITSPTIQVIRRSDGSDLVAAAAMVQVGSTGSYKYDEPTNRQELGESCLVVLSATIDGAARTWREIVGRDV